MDLSFLSLSDADAVGWISLVVFALTAWIRGEAPKLQGWGVVSVSIGAAAVLTTCYMLTLNEPFSWALVGRAGIVTMLAIVLPNGMAKIQGRSDDARFKDRIMTAVQQRVARAKQDTP